MIWILGYFAFLALLVGEFGNEFIFEFFCVSCFTPGGAIVFDGESFLNCFGAERLALKLAGDERGRTAGGLGDEFSFAEATGYEILRTVKPLFF